jgi:hypothetical protein
MVARDATEGNDPLQRRRAPSRAPTTTATTVKTSKQAIATMKRKPSLIGAP